MKLSHFIFLTAWSACYLFLRISKRYEVRGAEHIPAQGGCLLASNHASMLDPAVLSCGTGRRKAWFMARDTLFFGRPWFFKALRCIPLNRDRVEIGSLRRCIRMLQGGEMLALFPEGTRSRDGRLQEGRGGAGFLLAKAQVPVVPALVEGTFVPDRKHRGWWRRNRVRVTYGAPILPAELKALGKGRASHELVSRLIMDRISALAATE